MDNIEKEVLAGLKSMLSGRLPLHQMVLFGSRARGDAEPDSDMDVLVVLDCPVTEAEEDAVIDCAWEAGFERGIVVTPVTVSRHSWEDGPERSSLLARAIRIEGITI